MRGPKGLIDRVSKPPSVVYYDRFQRNVTNVPRFVVYHQCHLMDGTANGAVAVHDVVGWGGFGIAVGVVPEAHGSWKAVNDESVALPLESSHYT